MAMMGLLLRNFGTYGLPCYFSILSVQKFNVLPSPKLVSHRGSYFNMVRVSLGENGKLHVGVRRAMRQQATIPLSVISSHSMHIGVLTTAWHAYRTRTFFTVYYKPRFTGTIIGIEDADTKRWVESKWRSLKVRWDESSTIPSLERVSPWKIEPALTTVALNPFPCRTKKASIKYGALFPRLLCSYKGKYGPHLSCRSKTRAASRKLVERTTTSTHLRIPTQSRGLIPRPVLVQQPEAVKPKDRNCRLFGIPLISNHITMKPAHLHKTTIETNQRSEQIKGVNVADQPLPSVKQEKPSQMFISGGIALGRSVDLTKFSNYEELIAELDQLFEFNGELKAQNKNWLIVFIDDDGGMMLVGDDPWP
ncbi:Auxin response factor 18 [Camellia lanceoleosa]|uniref:Auxin response factor 18 n=1 Tax=Camellia lanceoleosa TaxID=1840588 RepID=A0ACC0GHF7_9ERIC|nr:Auxin response factor 18 [Camellia lanceoleosa]